MRYLLNTTEVYRVDEEPDAKALVEAIKDDGQKHGYIVKAYSITAKEKKVKGEVVDSAYLVKVTKEFYGSFWEV